MKITVCWQNSHNNKRAMIAHPILAEAGRMDVGHQCICTHHKFLVNGHEQCVHPGGPAFWDWFDNQPEGIAMHAGLINECEVEYDG